jgi:hypothetical protein
VPEYQHTNGDLAAELGVQLGLPPDEDQRDILNVIHAEAAPGMPTCFEVGIISPRQNIKTSTLQIAALADIALFDAELVVWTAHLFKTTQKAFQGMVRLIDQTPDFKERVRWPPRTANGDEAIEFETGQKIEFHARSKGSGRGFTGDVVVLDEALFVRAEDLGALLPTMATRRGAQVRWASSAGLAISEALRSIRDRGRRGGDPGLGYIEYCAPRADCATPDCTHVFGVDGCALDRQDLWWIANVALGRRITVERIQSFRRSMPPLEFAREFLGWWDDPPNTRTAWSVISEAAWRARGGLTDERPDPPVCFALAAAWPDAERGSICSAGRLGGELAVQAVDQRGGIGWMVAQVVELADRHPNCGFVLDEAGPAGQLKPDLLAAGFVVQAKDKPVMSRRALVIPSAREVGQAFGGFHTGVTGEQADIRHYDQPELADALAGAQTRPVGDAQTWARKTSAADISPLEAVTLAAWWQRAKPPSGQFYASWR